MAGQQPGDPGKAAARIFEAVSGQGVVGHLKGKIINTDDAGRVLR